MNKPTIVVAGQTLVGVAPVTTLAELQETTVKFAKLVQADPAVTVCKLATAVGDLSSSVLADNETDADFAEEVADVLIATMVVAANRGISAAYITQALQARLTQQLGDEINKSVHNMLAERGMDGLIAA